MQMYQQVNFNNPDTNSSDSTGYIGENGDDLFGVSAIDLFWTPSQYSQLESSLSPYLSRFLIQLIQSYVDTPTWRKTISELSKSPYFFNWQRSNRFAFVRDAQSIFTSLLKWTSPLIFLGTIYLSLLPFRYTLHTVHLQRVLEPLDGPYTSKKPQFTISRK